MSMKDFSRLEISTFIIETPICNTTIFVDSARTILILSTPIDKNGSPLQPHFFEIKSYIVGNKTKTGLNITILSSYHQNNSRLSYAQV